MYGDVQGLEGTTGSFEENVFRAELGAFHELWVNRQKARDARTSMREFVDAIQESDAAQAKNLSGEGIRFILNPPPGRAQEIVTAEILEAFLNGHFHAGSFADEEEYRHYRDRLHMARLCQAGKQAVRGLFPENPTLEMEIAGDLCRRIQDERQQGTRLWVIEGIILQLLFERTELVSPGGSIYVRDWIDGAVGFVHYISDTYLFGAAPAMLRLVEGLFQDEGGRDRRGQEDFTVGPLTLTVEEPLTEGSARCRLTLDDPEAAPLGVWLYRRRDSGSRSPGAESDIELERAFLFSGSEEQERQFSVSHDGSESVAWQLRVRSLRPETS